MRVIYLPGLDAQRPGESLNRFFRGLRSMDNVAFSPRDDPVGVGQRWFRLDQDHDVSVTELFWLGPDDYVQSPPNVFMRTVIGLRTLAFWITNGALWSATIGRGGLRFAASILFGFLLFLRWAAASVLAIADALGFGQGSATPDPNLVDKLLAPVFPGFPLVAILLLALVLSTLQVDRAVMFSAYLADFDRDRSRIRARKAEICAAAMRDILRREPPIQERERLFIVGHSMGGTVALDLIKDMVSGDSWPAVDITLVTFGAPVRMFRSSRDPERGPALFAAASPQRQKQTDPGRCQASWIDLYSHRDCFSAPMFDQPFSGTNGDIALSYQPKRLNALNKNPSMLACVRGETHGAYLHDPTALDVLLAELRSAA